MPLELIDSFLVKWVLVAVWNWRRGLGSFFKDLLAVGARLRLEMTFLLNLPLDILLLAVNELLFPLQML